MNEIHFLLKITDVIIITGRGTMVMGDILLGKISIGDKVKIIKVNNQVKLKIDEFETSIKNIEGYRREKILTAKEGDVAAFLLEGSLKFKPQKGMYLATGDGEKELDNQFTNGLQ